MVPGKNFKDPFAAAFERVGVTRTIVLSVPSFSVAAEVVAQTDLVTMLPGSFYESKERQLGLCVLSTALPPHATRFALSWHERTHADPAARAFRALVRQAVTGKRRPSEQA